MKLVQWTLWIVSVCCASAGAQTLPNGVAAGDVDQTSAVLWARSTVLGPVVFEYGLDPSLADAERITTDVVDPMIPTKVEVSDLLPGTKYFYEVTDSAGTVATGAFRTPFADGRHGLQFGVSGDWRGELRPYPSISNVPERDLDFFVGLGDTIYADVPSEDFPGEQAETLDEFRVKHNEVYRERFGVNSWADIRANTAWYAMIDDHEVTNDFAGGAPAGSDPRFDAAGDYLNETMLFENGLQAFHEFNPLREEFFADTGDSRTARKRKLYRFRRFGDDAAIFMLDARSFRDEELESLTAPPGGRAFREFVRASFDPARTMLGEAQLGDLFADLLTAEAEEITWKFILVPEPIQNLGPILASDRFEGYAYERTRILSFLTDHEIQNVVFISADIHGTIVNNIVYQNSPSSPQRRTPYFEITTGSVAYAAPFGPTTLEFAPPFLKTIYAGLSGTARDSFVACVADVLLRLYGYPTTGLRGSPVRARLLEGQYVAVHSYGWSEFDIDARTQRLTVTTYGFEWYDESELLGDPEEIFARTPEVVSRFDVDAMLRNDTTTSAAQVVGRLSPCGALGSVMVLFVPMISLSLCTLCRRYLFTVLAL